MSTVLGGGRDAVVSRSLFRQLVRVWLPVALMLLVIARESTEGFSGLHTSSILRPAWQAVFGVISDERWESVHHVLRKSGHFLGYGTLGLAFLRAWLLTWRQPLRLLAIRVWRSYAVAMALCCTATVAALDELHQTWLPDRTGLATDVLLDTTGAAVLCGMVAMWWVRRSRCDGI